MRYLFLKTPHQLEYAVLLEPVIEALYYKHQAHFNRSRIIVHTEHPDLYERNLFVWKTTQTLDYPSGKLMYNRHIDGKTFGPDTEMLHFDFTGPVTDQHLTDQFAARAGVNLLRRTPSVSNFEAPHMVAPDRPRIVVELREGNYRDDEIVIRKMHLPAELLSRTDVLYLRDEDPEYKVPSKLPPLSDYIKLIQGCDTYIGPAGAGPILALAGGVRNIIALHSKDVPPERYSFPEIQTFMSDRAGQYETFKRAIVHAITTPKYPEILHRGNAKAFIEAKAMFHCRGSGLDVGSNQWPLPGALPSDVDSRKFDQGPFDFIFSSHCLEHIKDWEEELHLWDRSLRPGGTCFLYVPHPAMEYWRPEGEWVKGGWHVWSPSPESLVHWLHENTNIEVQSYNSYPDFAWSFCLIGKRY